MEDVTIFIHLEKGHGRSERIGFVRVRKGSTYAMLRKEINDDKIEILQGHKFVFLVESGVQASRRQEEKYVVIDSEVHVRIIDDDVKGVSNALNRNTCMYQCDDATEHVPQVEIPTIQHVQNKKRDLSMVEEGERIQLEDDEVDVAIISSPPSTTDALDSKLKSKLAKKIETNKWIRDLKENMSFYRWKHGRKDRCEVMSADVNERAIFYVWCVECNERYGRGGHDTIYNYARHHCSTSGHMQNYECNLQQLVVVEETEKPEDRAKKNKELVENCLSTKVSQVIKETGVVFELYHPSVAGYIDTTGICIVCLTCQKTLKLFPKAGSIEFNMKEHITSNRHVQREMENDAKRRKIDEPKKCKGRPSWKDNPDSKQKNLFSFIKHGPPSNEMDGNTRKHTTSKEQERID